MPAQRLQIRRVECVTAFVEGVMWSHSSRPPRAQRWHFQPSRSNTVKRSASQVRRGMALWRALTLPAPRPRMIGTSAPAGCGCARQVKPLSPWPMQRRYGHETSLYGGPRCLSGHALAPLPIWRGSAAACRDRGATSVALPTVETREYRRYRQLRPLSAPLDRPAEIRGRKRVKQLRSCGT